MGWKGPVTEFRKVLTLKGIGRGRLCRGGRPGRVGKTGRRQDFRGLGVQKFKKEPGELKEKNIKICVLSHAI